MRLHLKTITVGAHTRTERPAQQPKRRGRKPLPIDYDAMRAALAELDALATQTKPQIRGANTLPATGHCHDCDRVVSGERRYCGPCLARRTR